MKITTLVSVAFAIAKQLFSALTKKRFEVESRNISNIITKIMTRKLKV